MNAAYPKLTGQDKYVDRYGDRILTGIRKLAVEI